MIISSCETCFHSDLACPTCLCHCNRAVLLSTHFQPSSTCSPCSQLLKSVSLRLEEDVCFLMNNYKAKSNPVQYHQTLVFTCLNCYIMCVLCVCAKSLQSCLTLCDQMDCLPGASVHGIPQARIQERVVIFFSRGCS